LKKLSVTTALPMAAAAHRHGVVAGRFRAADVAHQAADQGQQKDRAPAVAVREGLPDQWSNSQNGDLEGGEVADLLETDAQVCRHIAVRRDDARRREGGHGGVDGDKHQVGRFLSLVNIAFTTEKIRK
jgi:hypothetical protein